jgi:hypothetical protein
MSAEPMGLPEALERAASALRRDADAIRPANGDPVRLAEALGSEGSLRVLSWLLANEPEAGEELAEAWAEDPDGAGRVLLSLEPGTLPKPARKILRRVLHGLRSRGVAVPDEAPQPRVATLPPVADAIDEARVTPFDARGARVVSLATPHPGGGVRLFQIVVDDERGILDFEVLSAARRDVRRWLRDSARGSARGPVAIPPDSARALVARAAASQPASRSLPRGFVEWRARCAEMPEDSKTPGEIAREALPPADDTSAARERVTGWIRNGTLGPWPPESRWLQELAVRVSDARGGVLVVSDAARREQVRAAIDAAADELAQGAFASRTAARLEEVAYLLWKGERVDEARDCLAAARVLREPGAGRVSLARAFVETWLAPLLREAPKGEEAAAPLLVTP